MSQNNSLKAISINNKKSLLCSRIFLRKINSSGLQVLDQQNLLKYFPKYIHSLAVDIAPGYIISKVKCVKVLHVFKGYQNHSQSQNLRRTLLYNKERYIRSFYDEPFGIFGGLESQYSRHLVQEVRAFTGLQSLTLQTAHPGQLPHLERICKYMKSLDNLKSLKLKIDTEGYLSAISRLNSHERMLKSLETLEIDCIWGEDLEEKIRLVRGLLKNNNILKSTTHLKAGSFNGQTLLELLGDVLISSPKLVSLIVEADKGTSQSQSPSQYPQAFGTLNNLQTVQIVCRDTLNFLSNFALPSSIQNVDLHLLPFDPSMFKQLPQVLTTFCEKWSYLTNLKTLKIQIKQENDSQGIFTLQFVQSWLKRVRNLQSLSVDLSSDIYMKSDPVKGDLELSVFLECLYQSRNTLESLVILDLAKIYTLKNLPEQPFEFPRLLNLSLKGLMPQSEFLVKRLFETNLRDLLMAGSNEKPFEVILDGLNFDSFDTLFSFIKSFDREKNPQQRDLKVGVLVSLNNKEASSPSENCSRRFFMLASDGIWVDAYVSSYVEFDKNTEPRLRLENSLNFLKFA